MHCRAMHRGAVIIMIKYRSYRFAPAADSVGELAGLPYYSQLYYGAELSSEMGFARSADELELGLELGKRKRGINSFWLIFKSPSLKGFSGSPRK